jgi:hypothetical protein
MGRKVIMTGPQLSYWPWPIAYYDCSWEYYAYKRCYDEYGNAITLGAIEAQLGFFYDSALGYFWRFCVNRSGGCSHPPYMPKVAMYRSDYFSTYTLAAEMPKTVTKESESGDFCTGSLAGTQTIYK